MTWELLTQSTNWVKNAASFNITEVGFLFTTFRKLKILQGKFEEVLSNFVRNVITWKHDIKISIICAQTVRPRHFAISGCGWQHKVSLFDVLCIYNTFCNVFTLGGRLRCVIYSSCHKKQCTRFYSLIVYYQITTIYQYTRVLYVFFSNIDAFFAWRIVYILKTV